MCEECGPDCRGWCRAFTPTEVALSLLQAVLLTVLIAFFTFLILHLITCDNLFKARDVTSKRPEKSPTSFNSSNGEPERPSSNGTTAQAVTIEHPTVGPDIACTWTPSAKTQAVTQYFELGYTTEQSEANDYPVATLPSAIESQTQKKDLDFNELNGEPANDLKNFIMALVKMKPPDDIIFGCTLTIISEFWTLTAASCIEAIEEVDSLDSFVMMEDFGEPVHGRVHVVSDVLIHPQYQGTNNTYDIVALKSEDTLGTGDMFLRLPTTLDYLLIAIGERLTILGFGKFRSIDKDAFSRGARAVAVHALPAAQCAGGGGGGARHLAAAGAAARAACGAGALCAGPLRARAAPCTYCAGTPLLRARVLLALLGAAGACGAPCDPAPYVPLPAARAWLRSVLAGSAQR